MTLVEKLTSIKYKLNKYANSNNKSKLCEYLNVLKSIQTIDASSLKEADIVSCLKELKKNHDAEIGQLGGEIISKWKKICLSNQQVNETSNNGLKVEAEPPKQKTTLSLKDYKKKTNKTEENFNANIVNNHSAHNNVVKKEPTMKHEPTAPIVPKPTEPLSNIFQINTNKPFSLNNLPKSSLNSLPTTMSSYSPKSQPSNYKSQSSIDDDNLALEKIMRSKKSSQFIYTGKKNASAGHQQVSRLYDLAVQALVNSLDDLPNRISIYNTINEFPIAFDLIKPVIEKTNARQLQLIEHYSPNLMEDSDYIWKRICEKEFKGAECSERDEDIWWRDFYTQKQNERKHKFDSVRNKISAIQANKPQERKTQIATMKTKSDLGKRSSSGSMMSYGNCAAKSMNGRGGGGGGSSSVSKFQKPNVAPPKRPNFSAPPVQSKGMKAASKLLKQFRR